MDSADCSLSTPASRSPASGTTASPERCCTWRPTGPVISQRRRHGGGARPGGRRRQRPLRRRPQGDPGHWAASSDDVEILDALLDAGAEIDADGAVVADGTPTDLRHGIRPVAHSATSRRTRRPRRPLGGRHPRPARPRPCGLAATLPRRPRTSPAASGAFHGDRRPQPSSCSTAAPTSTRSVGTASPRSMRLSATAPEISPIGCAPTALDLPGAPRRGGVIKGGGVWFRLALVRF